MNWLRYMYENQRSDLASIVNYLTMAVLIVLSIVLFLWPIR